MTVCSPLLLQSSSHGDKSSGEGYLWNPLGIHLLESSTSPLIAKRFLDANASSEGESAAACNKPTSEQHLRWDLLWDLLRRTCGCEHALGCRL